MEVVGQFGINPILLLAQVVNFLIILYLVKRFALKPILNTLKNREKTIKEGLKQADEARKMLESAEEREREILRKAQTEAKTLLADAKREREEMLSQAEERTRQQAEKMLLEAREQITFETREAEKRLSAHVSELAAQFLKKSVNELFNEKDQELVMKHALTNLKKKAD